MLKFTTSTENAGSNCFKPASRTLSVKKFLLASPFHGVGAISKNQEEMQIVAAHNELGVVPLNMRRCLTDNNNESDSEKLPPKASEVCSSKWEIYGQDITDRYPSEISGKILKNLKKLTFVQHCTNLPNDIDCEEFFMVARGNCIECLYNDDNDDDAPACIKGDYTAKFEDRLTNDKKRKI